MTPIRPLLFALLTTAAATALPAAAKTIYVSADGPEAYYDEDEGRWYCYEGGFHFMDGEPGDSWETAYPNMEAACDAAEAGDTVLVGPGTYHSGPHIYMGNDYGKNLTIRSVAGADATVILGDYVHLGDSDRLVGFTLDGDGSWCGLSGGHAESCVIRNFGDYDNEISSVTSSMVPCYNGMAAVDSILSDCIIENCKVRNGAALRCTLDRCIVRNNRSNGAGGLACCIAFNTLIVGNRSEVMDPDDSCQGYCGGADQSELYNCTVVGNYAERRFGGVGGLIWDQYGSLYRGSCLVYNSIVVDNTCGGGETSNYGQTGNDREESLFDNGSIFAYSCSYPKPAGTGNIEATPRFANAETYALAAGSAGIDAGNDAWVQRSCDLNGRPRIHGGRVDMGACEFAPATPVSGRFDGDGRDDIALFNHGTWQIEASSLGRSSVSFGSGDCIPVPADYDGDGTTDLSVYDTVTGDWWIRYSTGLNGRSWICDNFGSLTCKPFPADYDGDGKADLSVWDGRTGDWFIRYSSGHGPNGMSWIKDNFGSLSCIPVPADYDGDGKADLSVRDNATGDWWTRYSSGCGPNGMPWSGDNFGSTVCAPYPADYDGDGLADLSVYDQETGDWFVRFSGGGWTKDNFGMKTCIPVPADYDGDGLADFAVYDTAYSTFWVRYSGGGWTSVEF